MTLLFITRKVDRGDALTGFVFTWLAVLAEHLDKLYVICQEKGDVSGLPGNVEVYSFGKEKGYGKLRQGFTLFALNFKLAKNSAGIFVHMHPIYAILSWLPAKVLGKKIVLWYTHKAVDLKLRVAHALVDAVFTASKESFRLPSRKVRIVGHGIDLNKFKVKSEKLKIKRSKFKIVSIGRISPVKDYETLLKAVKILIDRGKGDLEVEIYGRIGLPSHQSYLDSLVNFVRNAGLEEVIKFQGELDYEYVDEVYREANLFVNLSQTGSIDKAVLEAAASGTLVLTSNEAFQEGLEKIGPFFFFERDNPESLTEKILLLKTLSPSEREKFALKLRAWVEKEHNLDKLVKVISAEFSKV